MHFKLKNHHLTSKIIKEQFGKNCTAWTQLHCMNTTALYEPLSFNTAELGAKWRNSQWSGLSIRWPSPRGAFEQRFPPGRKTVDNTLYCITRKKKDAQVSHACVWEQRENRRHIQIYSTYVHKHAFTEWLSVCILYLSWQIFK